MNIYINLEIEKRELLSKILLSLEAANKGHDVYLGRINPLLNNNLLKPGIVHFKSITPGFSRLQEMKNLKKNNFLFTTLDEEHGLINNNGSYKNYRYSEETFKLVDKVFTWGKFDFNNIISKFSKFKNKIIKSGNPRIDFWRNDFINFFKNNKLVPYKNYIFFSCNFEGVSHLSLSDKIKFYEDTGYFQRGLKKKDLITTHNNSIKLLKKYIKSIKNLSKKFKNRLIIVRPHPKDNSKKWKKFFLKFKNVKIIDDGFLSDWIANSNIVIHAGCTGGLESSMRNINTISYYPIKIFHGHKFADKFSKKIYNEKQLIKEIENSFIKKSKKLSFNKNEFYKRSFNFNGKRSYKIIAIEWQKLSKKIQYKKNNILIIKLLYKILNFKLKIKRIEPGNHKFRKFNKYLIKNIIQRLSSINKDFESIEIDYLNDDLIRFYK